MPAHEAQTHVKESEEIIKVYASQPLCLYQDPTLIFQPVHYNLHQADALHLPVKMAY